MPVSSWRVRARAALVAFVAATAVAAFPLPAGAVAPAAKPAPKLVTVDHPPVDGVRSFDNGPRDSGKVALTFDADMTTGMLAQLRAGAVRSWYNQDVREVLDSEKVPATMFLTGLWALAYPDVARSLAADPLFELGSHTYDHLAFRTPCYGLGAAGDRAGEVAIAQEQIASVVGFRPSLLRFPGDCYDASDVALADSQGLAVISGDVRGGDAFNGSAASVAATVLGGVRGGSIVVLHMHGAPNAPMTAAALRLIIPALRARGLGFGTVTEVLGPARPAPVPKRSRAAIVLTPLRLSPLSAPPASTAGQVMARLRSQPLLPPARPSPPQLPGALAAILPGAVGRLLP